jgi:very-short-patch-repair endonuclease
MRPNRSEDQEADAAQRSEVLIAILNNRADFDRLQSERWYRIPVENAPKRWPPKWLAFYQTKVFGAEAYAINYFGRVADIRVVQRAELFPNEIASSRAGREYYQVRLASVESLANPLRSRRPRRLVFQPTTWRKFTAATELNDLFDESPLEDTLWARLKEQGIAAERQWEVQIEDRLFRLDFAIFCTGGNLDVETDGDTWHTRPDDIPRDNERNSALAQAKWHVLRFNGRQLRERQGYYSVSRITKVIQQFGGLNEGIVPRRFVPLPDGPAQQLSFLGGTNVAETDPDDPSESPL